MSDIRPAHPIGKTQWAKWGDEAREAFNHCIRVGYTFDTAVAEGTAKQKKVQAEALAELVRLGQEQDAEGADQPPAEAQAEAKVEESASPSPTASAPAPKKPRTPRKKKAE